MLVFFNLILLDFVVEIKQSLRSISDCKGNHVAFLIWIFCGCKDAPCVLPELSFESDSESEVSEDSEVFSGR